MTVDPAGDWVTDMSNPQSLNRYSYVWNRPMVLVDPSGLDPCVNGTNPTNGNICSVTTASGGGSEIGSGGGGLPLNCFLIGSFAQGEVEDGPTDTGARTEQLGPGVTFSVNVQERLPQTDIKKYTCDADVAVNYGLSAFVPAYGVASALSGRETTSSASIAFRRS